MATLQGTPAALAPSPTARTNTGSIGRHAMNAVDATQFETYRPLLFSIAYRMLGSATDAEDIVQEAFLRYQATAPSQIVSPKAFLTTIVTRLCLNQLRSAKAQRETYIGPWLPEPVLTGVDEHF